MEVTQVEDKIILESNQESINRATSYVDEILSTTDEKLKKSYGNIIIALTEAINNAISHGNKNNSDKYVTVCYKKTEKYISFTVEDEGNGFDYKDIPDPTAPENLTKINGRGIFLMKNLADNIEFFENGKKIELIFNLA
jgi:serine/threonine-protein kinase RsbW